MARSGITAYWMLLNIPWPVWDSLGPIKNKPRGPTYAYYLSDNAEREQLKDLHTVLHKTKPGQE